MTGRRARIAALFEREARRVERLVSRRARAPQAVIEDACQAAWARLCARDDVDVESPAVLRWLVVTAVHEAWRHTSGNREVTAGGFLPDPEVPGELPEPQAHGADPLAVTVQRDEARRRIGRLTERERQFLALQAAGLTYEEIAKRLSVSVRTVERQILRGRRKLRQEVIGVDA
jgi:RNA polymerase sigma factor (sigma-70 family)